MRRICHTYRFDEKLLAVFAFLGFILLMIWAYSLLPVDIPDRVSLLNDEIAKRGNQILLPNVHGPGRDSRLWGGRSIDDKEKLQRKIEEDSNLVLPLPLSHDTVSVTSKTKVLPRRTSARSVFSNVSHMSPQMLSRMNLSMFSVGESTNATIRQWRAKVRSMTLFAWDNYVKYAWGRNELRPVTKVGHTANIFGSMPIGATIMDALDTLYIMGLHSRYEKAKEFIVSTLDFKKVRELSVFEANIRFLGGLLSTYALTGDYTLIDKAVALADLLLAAFDSPTGIPYALLNLQTKNKRNYNWASGGCSILSEFGTLHMEFAYLSEITGNAIYRQKVDRVRERLAAIAKPNGLYPNYLNPRTGRWCMHHTSMAGLGDSFYEYLLKEWIRSGRRDAQARRMYDEAMRAVGETLLKRSIGGFYYLGDYKNGRVATKMDHLACFSGGLFALGAKDSPDSKLWLDRGVELTRTCRESYARSVTRLGPEAFHFSSRSTEAVGIMARDKPYLLRPETVESYFYLWRLTGDHKYRDWGWDVVNALEKHCKAEAGYSGLKDVYSYSPRKDDVQQSYFLAETLKYLYLLFSDDSLLPLDKWVFNTEGHPFPIRSG